MSRILETDWQLGALAFDSDLIDSQQLCSALRIWANHPDQSLFQILLNQESLRPSDLPLLQALWQHRISGSASTQLSMAESTSAVSLPRDHQFADPADSIDNAALTDSHSISTLLSSVRLDLDQHLAKGGIGQIDVARDRELNRRVAVKRIQTKFATDARARIRFAQEAEITGELEHPAIVPIYHYGISEEGEPFYCMRLIEGRNLREVVAGLFGHNTSGRTNEQFESIEFRRLLQSFVTICRAISHAHAKGIIHRDIKPANIIIGDHGETMLVDWGLAKRLDAKGIEDSISFNPHTVDFEDNEDPAECHLTLDGVAVGTPAYMSPEQASINGSVGTHSDIFGLGATLYFVLTGRAPYRSSTAQESLELAKDCSWNSARDVCSSVPVALNAICQNAMAVSPLDRYASAELMAEDIERYLADDPVSVWQDGVATKVRRWIKKHRSETAVVAVSLAALLVGAVAFSLHTSIANQRLNVAYSREQESRSLAMKHGELAMKSLRTVTLNIQRDLQHVPAAQKVRLKLLETALDGLNQVSTGVAQQSEIDLGLVIAHRDLGDLFFEVGNVGDQLGLQSARREFDLAYQVATKLAQHEPENIEAQRQLALCMHRIASIKEVEGSLADAEAIYAKAHDQLQRLVQRDLNNESVIRSVAVSHNLQGSLLMKQGKIDQAGEHYIEAFRIREQQWSRGVRNDDLERDRIVSLNKVGNYLQRIGKDSEAEQHFRKALKASQERADKMPDDFNALRDLSTAFYLVGKVCQSSGRDLESLNLLQSSAELDRRRLSLDPANSLAQRDCVQSCNELATALRRLDKNEEAIEQLEFAIKTGEQMLLASSSDKRVLRDLAYAYSDLGDLVKSQQPDIALSHYENCLKLMQQSAELSPENLRSKSDVAFGLTRRADGLLKMKRTNEALTDYTQALELQRQRYQASPADIVVQSSFVEILHGLIDVLVSSNQADQARPFAEESVEAARKLSQQAQENKLVQVLFVQSLELLGRVHRLIGDNTEAKIHLKEALENIENLKRLSPLSSSEEHLLHEIQQQLKGLPE